MKRVDCCLRLNAPRLDDAFTGMKIQAIGVHTPVPELGVSAGCRPRTSHSCGRCRPALRGDWSDCPRPLGRNRRKDCGSLGTTEGARMSDRVLQQRHRGRLEEYRNARAAFPWIGCHSWSLRLALSVSSWTLVRDRTAVAVVFDEDPRCPLSGRSLPCRNDAFGEVSGLSVFQCASHYSR